MYDIPKCECGQPLVMYSEEIHKLYTPITKKGTLSSRSVRNYNDGSSGVYERLTCTNCRNEYWATEDKKGRIIRSETFKV